MEYHESLCSRNPANHTCLSCKHDSREPPIDISGPDEAPYIIVLNTCVLGHRDIWRDHISGCKHYQQKR
jgi:hypothetical protein